MSKKRWSIGIDPGFKETGVVLRAGKNEKIWAWATYGVPPAEGITDLARSTGMADTVMDIILHWVSYFEIKQLNVVIELPVYKRNASTLIKQIRLLEDIQAGVLFTVADQVELCYLTELYPSSVKSLACHGKATKDEMIEACPIMEYEVAMFRSADASTELRHTLETVADAWAISLGGWRENTRRYNFTELQAAVVHTNSRSGDNSGV